jgi:hypothetical protein
MIFCVAQEVASVLRREFPDSSGWTCEHVHRGGSQGAEVWASVSGQRVVVKRHPEGELAYFLAVRERINRLRVAGVPAPATTVARDGEDVLLLLDYLPGRSDPPLSSDLIDQLLDIVGYEAGLADSSPAAWRELIGTSLSVGLSGYCEHGSLFTFSDASRALLARVRRVGADPAGTRLLAPDLVHYDLHPDNVLSVDGRRVSGIIDWDAVRTGDRALDLALLAFSISWRTADSGLLEQVWKAFLSTSTHDARVIYMHHVALRLVDWIIRHGNTPGPERTIELAAWALAVTESGEFSLRR